MDERTTAYRALCLGTLLMRANLEDSLRRASALPQDRPRPELWEAVNSWLEKYAISASLSPKERHLLAKPVGSWSPQETINASWRAEALGVILWALEWLKKIPTYDTQFSAPEILRFLPMGRQPDDFVRKSKLRSNKDLSKARDLAELWNWRGRTTRIQNDKASLPPGMTFQQIISNSARQAHKAGMISTPIDNDFPLYSKAFGKLSEEEYQSSASISQERHFTLNWLTGHSKDWDNTPTET